MNPCKSSHSSVNQKILTYLNTYVTLFHSRARKGSPTESNAKTKKGKGSVRGGQKKDHTKASTQTSKKGNVGTNANKNPSSKTHSHTTQEQAEKEGKAKKGKHSNENTKKAKDGPDEDLEAINMVTASNRDERNSSKHTAKGGDDDQRQSNDDKKTKGKDGKKTTDIDKSNGGNHGDQTDRRESNIVFRPPVST